MKIQVVRWAEIGDGRGRYSKLLKTHGWDLLDQYSFEIDVENGEEADKLIKEMALKIFDVGLNVLLKHNDKGGPPLLGGGSSLL